MSKSESLHKCPYCGRPCSSIPGVERHIVQRPACAAKRAKERNKIVGTNLAPTQRQAPPDPNRSHPTTAAGPSNAEDMDHKRQSDERLERDLPSLGRNPSAVPNDVDDVDMDMPSRPGSQTNSPRRNPSVTLEEVEDVDMRPRPKRWGPHPFAKPTRCSRYPKPHPDPTAGEPVRVYPVDTQVPPLYTSKLAEPDVFSEAYWLDNLPITLESEEQYFKLPRTKGWYWDSVSELEQEIFKLPRGPQWYRETKVVDGDQGREVLDLWKRDVRDIVRWILRNRRLIRYTRYAPEKQFDSPTMENPIYSEMWTGEWWWRMQNILGPHATVAPIIISSDKTKMTVFSGNQKAWPVYLSLGNVSVDIRKRPSECAMLLIGFIPVTPLTNISDREERSEHGWQLFHACMESILEPLKEVSRVGMEVLCADGGVRRVFPILAAYIADFPEQATIACIRDSGCPICWVPGNERGNLSARYPIRDRRRTLDALRDHLQGFSGTIRDLGIRPTRPFWADLPHVNISGCLTPDLLHQLDKGVLGNHIVKWCTALLGVNEMNRRTKGMPRFQRLRYFKQGISVINQWTGKEAKALASILLSIMAGYRDSKVVTAVRCILDFSYRAHLPELSEEDLKAMERDLEEFEKVKAVFIDKDVKGLLPNAKRFHKIPKIHMLLHYCYLIRELGAAVGYSTEITERLHIDCVKEPWRATNHVNPIPQMISYLEKKEAWMLLRAYLHDARLVINTRFQETYDDGDEDDDQDLEEEEVGGGGDADADGAHGTWQPCPSISIAKRPALGRKQGVYLIEEHGAVDLIPATIRYLHSIAPETPAPVFEESFFTVWKRCKLHHRRLPFYLALNSQPDSVRAFPSTIDEEGRLVRQGLFDVVLFSPITDDGINRDGLHRLQAGRVRVIFELPNQLRRLFPEKLVYLEHFQPFSTRPSPTTGLYTTSHEVQGGCRSVSVIPLSRLRMTCHLTPWYHLLDPNLGISPSTDLLAVHNHFYLNKYVTYQWFLILEYWEKQRRLNNRDCIFVVTRFTLPCPGYPPTNIPRLEPLRRDSVSFLVTTTAGQPSEFTTSPSEPCFATPDHASFRPLHQPPQYPPSSMFHDMTPADFEHSPSTTTHHTSPATTNALPVGTSSLRVRPISPIILPPQSPSRRDRSSSNPLKRFYYSPFLGRSGGNDNISSSKFSSAGTNNHGGGGISPSPHIHSDDRSSPAHLSGRSTYTHDIVNRSAKRPSTHMAQDTLFGEDRESEYERDPDHEFVHWTHEQAREARRQHIVESERRRCDRLRDGFAQLKDTLPTSTEKNSKLGLIERAANHVRYLQDVLHKTQERLAACEMEVARLRKRSEAVTRTG